MFGTRWAAPVLALVFLSLAFAGCTDSTPDLVPRKPIPPEDGPVVSLLKSEKWPGQVTGVDKGPIQPGRGYTVCGLDKCGTNQRYFYVNKDADRLVVNVTWTKSEYGADNLYMSLSKWDRSDARHYELREFAHVEGPSKLTFMRDGKDFGGSIMISILPVRDAGVVYNQPFEAEVLWYRVV